MKESHASTPFSGLVFMKKLRLKTFFLALVSLFLAGTANAAVITVGEGNTGEGPALYGDVGGIPLPWTYGTDPTGSLSGNVLYYTLPKDVIAGDVWIRDPWENNAVGDIIRFSGKHLVFYSLGEPNVTPHVGGADVTLSQFQQILNNPSANHVTIFEKSTNSVNPEAGLQWADYATGFNQPGFLLYPNGSGTHEAAALAPPVYKFVSDVPEPSTYALMALGGLLLAFRLKKSGIGTALSV